MRKTKLPIKPLSLFCPWCNRQYTVNHTMAYFHRHLMKYRKKDLASLVGSLIAKEKIRQEKKDN